MSQTIGQKVRALRKSRNVSQEILCGVLNMSKSTFSYKERVNKFTTDELQIICKTLNFPYDILISDAPFNPMRINFERNDTVFVNEPETTISIFRDSDPVYLTEKEKSLLKKFRMLTPKNQPKVFDCIEKLENGEQ